jgi:hypothetical protein
MSEAQLRGMGWPCNTKAVFAWGCRAIFKPRNEQPLDILYDRQGHYYPGISDTSDGGPLYKLFLEAVNGIIPELQDLSKWFEGSSQDMFSKNYPYPHDDKLVMVAAGSPNASFGYFYISVSLVSRADAAEEKEPHGLVESRNAAAERKRRLTEITETMRAWERKDKLGWTEKHDRERLILDREICAVFKEPGKALEPGDRIEVSGREDVYWFVLFANRRQVLVERYTVKGNRQLLTVDANHRKRSSHTRIPEWATTEGYVE